MALNGQSTVNGEGEVWEATAPAAATATGLWMAWSPEVVITRAWEGITGQAPAIDMKNVIVDPRAFTNLSGYVFDAFLLVKGDIIEMTGDGITGIDTATYLVPTAGAFVLAAATEAGTGLSLKKIGTSKLHIGNTALNKPFVTTYKFEVVNN
jgi:hypothetical protein